MTYENDKDFDEKTIQKVEKAKTSYWLTMDDGWCLNVPMSDTVVPKEGMPVRIYPKGFGSQVRGLFVDGKKVWYRTEDEQKEHMTVMMYGKDAKEWLTRWDEKKTVWSIEMGGLGPSYEQAIQITMVEIVRHFVDKDVDASQWEKEQEYRKARKDAEAAMLLNRIVAELGLSGAQFGAAMNLATSMYKEGPRAILERKEMDKRKIQINNKFPSAA